MKSGMKAAILVAVILVIVGIVIAAGSLALTGFKFDKLSTKEYKTTVLKPTGSFDKIDVTLTTAELTFVPASDGVCTVTCHDDEKIKYTAEVKGGVLTVSREDARKGLDILDPSINLEKNTVTVALPGKNYAALTVKTDTGDVTIPEDFSFGSLTVSGDTADVSCAAPVSGALAVKLSTGDVTLTDLSAGELDLTVSTGDIRLTSVDCAGGASVTVSTGRTELTDVRCASLRSAGSTGKMKLTHLTVVGEAELRRSTGDISFVSCTAGTLRVTTDTGDVKFEDSDAGTIWVKTDTGDVTGFLRKPMVIFAETNTGKVDVPKLTEGGRCEITTDTGNIKLSVTVP